MEVSGVDDGSDYLSVTESLQGLVPDVDGMLDRTFPIRVLVGNGCQYF